MNTNSLVNFREWEGILGFQIEVKVVDVTSDYNLKNAKEASEVTEGKSSRMYWVR